ncbi:DHHC zinc finger domain-containing protein [Encephalitozoon intestinalis ATCC 50506]|uniref:Palmitoyltransferase n=1 Tax=Encephalitozoon intestinalis (strain ATCC 50506) TaxID=876142 RepID=E0S959_ENCIT|nr:DHHC zinc finger domain-containing protein [Encephalitozoon intestinalis ATCC 50506]ADM12152.1 DHHC zinc finger domain-containing protein [Encephalitozoon intestinalis ATCC 50506]UTX45953.1 DHHC palmitoyltransferase [Encephalitozoon intestinalis]
MGKIRPNFRMTLLISSLAFTYIAPLSEIILPAHFTFKGTYVVLLLLSSTLSAIYLMLSILYRGHVESNSEAINLIDHDEIKRFCKKCRNHKPERAHHCSSCGHCIKKMDHHCFWINNCVNYDNQGHFIRFLFFTALANWLIFLYMSIEFIAVLLFNKPLRHRRDYYILVISGISSLVFLVMTSFFFYLQLRLALMNMTFIEEMKQEDMNKIQGLTTLRSPYDRGIINNLIDTLGPPYALFLIGPFGDGMTFAKRHPIEHWKLQYDYHCIEDLIVI